MSAVCAEGDKVMVLLTERGVNVSSRSILRWAQALGPWLGQESRRRWRPLPGRWFADDVFVRVAAASRTWSHILTRDR